MKPHRGVSNVVATLLMVSIAAIGGTSVFGVSQGFFNENQPALPASMEKLDMIGYDATDSQNRTTHQNVINFPVGVARPGNELLQKSDRVYIYLQNPGLQPVTIQKLSFAGESYRYYHPLDCELNSRLVGAVALINTKAPIESEDIVAPSAGEFAILNSNYYLDCSKIPQIAPGDEVSVIIGNADAIKLSREAQLKITTGKGTVIAHKIQLGLLQEK